MEKDNIYSQLREYKKELQDDAKDHLVAMDALERVLELEVKVFRLGKKLENIKGWIVAIYIGFFIALITDILR